MGWDTRGLRGSSFEEMINMTNERYRQKKLAVVQKIPTPITPVEVDNIARTITLAYFGQKSTVDYIGAAQGYPVCFDAKETAAKSLPITNIHEHQIIFMEDFCKQGGIAFLLVLFSYCNECYFLSFPKLKKHWETARGGGRKSIAYESFEKKYLLTSKSGFLIHYLEGINTFLETT